MKPVFINSASCISAQDTLETDFFELLSSDISRNIAYARQPSYKDYISPGALRRMSKVVKMSTIASSKALHEAGVEVPDAIIVGTGMGCTEDSEKFLRNVIQNDENFLTPTNFIQSTHNTVAGQIALGIGCHAYNFTYVNSGSALEFALLDAKLQIENEEAKHVLVGAADETAERTAELYQIAGIIKRQSEFPIDLLNASSKGVFWGEGSAFFILEPHKTANTYSQIADVFIQNSTTPTEIPKLCEVFLANNNLKFSDIDAILLGFGGDADADEYYKILQEYFSGSAQIYYKHLSGDFNTAGGFGLFLAANIIKKQQIPEIIRINEVKTEKIRNILIYNNFLGRDHSFVLLRSPGEE